MLNRKYNDNFSIAGTGKTLSETVSYIFLIIYF